MLHAVIIGIDSYRDPRIPELICARSDAEMLSQLLLRRIVPAEREVHTLVDEQATSEGIIDALRDQLPHRCEPDDVVMVYFAGHGCPERDSPRSDDLPFLVAHDTDYDDIANTGIDMINDVSELLHGLPARLVVMFIDACFSGAAGGRTFGGPVFMANRDRFRSELVSLDALDLGAGRVIITAADDKEVATESLHLGHGVFTHYLMESLQRPASGDGAGDGTIGLGALYENVARGVRKETGGRQHPVSNGRSVGGALPLLGVTP